MNLFRRRVPGQTIVLLALMLIVLVGFVGLSVDVGNAVSRQRRSQSAANAGALAGMNGARQGITWGQVRVEIAEALRGHGVTGTAAAASTLSAFSQLRNKDTGAVEAFVRIPNSNDAAPKNVFRIRVVVNERVDTYFARVVGRNNLPARAQALACGAGYGTATYPFGVPFSLRAPDNRWVATWNGSEGNSSYSAMPGSSQEWQIDDKFLIPFASRTITSTAQFAAILTFNADGDRANLGAELTIPGTYHFGGCQSNSAPGCYEEIPPSALGTGSGARDSTYGILQQDYSLTLQDWIKGNKSDAVFANNTPIYNLSANSSARARLDFLKSADSELLLPMYDRVFRYENVGAGAALGEPNGGQDRNSAFQAKRMGRFVLIDYYVDTASQVTPDPLYPTQEANGYLVLQYKGQALPSAVVCALPGSGAQ